MSQRVYLRISDRFAAITRNTLNSMGRNFDWKLYKRFSLIENVCNATTCFYSSWIKVENASNPMSDRNIRVAQRTGEFRKPETLDFGSSTLNSIESLLPWERGFIRDARWKCGLLFFHQTLNRAVRYKRNLLLFVTIRIVTINQLFEWQNFPNLEFHIHGRRSETCNDRKRENNFYTAC